MFVAAELGDRVQDPISGFTGIVVGISIWLNGGIRIAVQPEGLQDGKPIEAQLFDRYQVAIIEQNVHTPMVMAVAKAPLLDTDARSATATVHQDGGVSPVYENAAFQKVRQAAIRAQALDDAAPAAGIPSSEARPGAIDTPIAP